MSKGEGKSWSGPIIGRFVGMVPRGCLNSEAGNRKAIDSENMKYHRFRALFREGASKSPFETCCKNHKRFAARAMIKGVVVKTIVAKTRNSGARHSSNEKVFSVKRLFRQVLPNSPSRIVPVKNSGCRWKKVLYHRATFEELPKSFKDLPRAFPRFSDLVRRYGYGKAIRRITCYADGISVKKNELARTIRSKFARKAFLTSRKQELPFPDRNDYGTWNDYRQALKENQTIWYLCRQHYKQAFTELYNREFRYWKGWCSFDTVKPRLQCGDCAEPLDNLVALKAPPEHLVCHVKKSLSQELTSTLVLPWYEGFNMKDTKWIKYHDDKVKRIRRELEEEIKGFKMDKVS
ncbi:hydrophilic protein [Wheat white spike virus]|uniref:Hydrophilic protein n=1 Tax=Wheat white spike virus TaxID=2871179 RepID=A0AAX1PBK0_9VIRU|nr:hydrophilic protein [Wheat white spike virus]